LTLNAGKLPGNQPARLAQFDDGNDCAILVQGDEGPAQSLPRRRPGSFSWGIGALRQLFASDDGAISFAACPIPSHCWRKPDSNLRFPDRSAPLREQSASHVGLTVSRPGTEISKSISLQRRVYCEPGRPGPGGMASAAATLAVAAAALRLANPCGISGVAKPVAQQDRRSAPPDGRDRI
jgi:hypothetical protein